MPTGIKIVLLKRGGYFLSESCKQEKTRTFYVVRVKTEYKITTCNALYSLASSFAGAYSDTFFERCDKYFPVTEITFKFTGPC